MGEVVNLRRERKRKSRAESESRAAANRRAHGVPKSERDKAALERALAEKRLDSHSRRDDADER